MLNLFIIVYFQIGLGNAIGCVLLNEHKGSLFYKTFSFILDFAIWPFIVGLELAKKAGK